MIENNLIDQNIGEKVPSQINEENNEQMLENEIEMLEL